MLATTLDGIPYTLLPGTTGPSLVPCHFISSHTHTENTYSTGLGRMPTNDRGLATTLNYSAPSPSRQPQGHDYSLGPQKLKNTWFVVRSASRKTINSHRFIAYFQAMKTALYSTKNPVWDASQFNFIGEIITTILSIITCRQCGLKRERKSDKSVNALNQLAFLSG